MACGLLGQAGARVMSWALVEVAWVSNLLRTRGIRELSAWHQETGEPTAWNQDFGEPAAWNQVTGELAALNHLDNVRGCHQQYRALRCCRQHW